MSFIGKNRAKAECRSDKAVFGDNPALSRSLLLDLKVYCGQLAYANDLHGCPQAALAVAAPAKWR